MFGFISSAKIKKLEYEINDLKKRLCASIKDSSEWREIALHYRQKWEITQRSRNELVDLINRKGGQDFLDYATIPGRNERHSNMFTKEELKTILILIHPDKHGNGRHGKMAEDLFKSINNMLR